MREAKERLGQAAGHLLHQRTAKAMRTLIEVQSERNWKEAQLKAGLTRLRNGKLSAGWNSWVTMAFERREAMVLMRRGVSFMKNRKLAPAFQSWLAAIDPSSSAQSAEQQRESMSKALRHLLHRELSRGWVGWHAQWLEVVRKRAEALSMSEEDAQRERDSMSKALRHLLHRELSRGWTEWHVQWQELQSSKRDAQRKRDGMSKALRHMLHRELSRCWTAWAAARQQARTSAKLTLP